VNKGIQFWLDLWQQGRIPFHKNEVHPDLITFWPSLQLKPKSTVLVPLCGKSRDILWFMQQGYHVVGIELCEQAVVQFFHEHQLSFTIENHKNCKKYLTDYLDLWVGDIFTIDKSLIPPVDAIYDRAALIALPQKIRSRYTALCLNWLKPQGVILLKTLSYDQNSMQGPPYSVSPEEVVQLYTASTTIQCLNACKQEHVRDEENTMVVDGYLWGIIKHETKI
jgi:thiopurine S-methyltransferase